VGRPAFFVLSLRINEKELEMETFSNVNTIVIGIDRVDNVDHFRFAFFDWDERIVPSGSSMNEYMAAINISKTNQRLHVNIPSSISIEGTYLSDGDMVNILTITYGERTYRMMQGLSSYVEIEHWWLSDGSQEGYEIYENVPMNSYEELLHVVNRLKNDGSYQDVSRKVKKPIINKRVVEVPKREVKEEFKKEEEKLIKPYEEAIKVLTDSKAKAPVTIKKEVAVKPVSKKKK